MGLITSLRPKQGWMPHRSLYNTRRQEESEINGSYLLNWDMHFNSADFTEPFSFKPERWLSLTTKMLQSFVPFVKGSKSCIGGKLARMELSMTVGNLFSRFRFDLFETTEYDVRIAHDYFVPATPSNSKGVRMVVR